VKTKNGHICYVKWTSGPAVKKHPKALSTVTQKQLSCPVMAWFSFIVFIHFCTRDMQISEYCHRHETRLSMWRSECSFLDEWLVYER